MVSSKKIIEQLFEKCNKGEFCCLADMVLFLYESDKKCKQMLDLFLDKVNNFAIEHDEFALDADNDFIRKLQLTRDVKKAASTGIASDKSVEKNKEFMINELNHAAEFIRSSNLQPNPEFFFRYFIYCEQISELFYDVVTDMWSEDSPCFDFAEELFDELGKVAVSDESQEQVSVTPPHQKAVLSTKPKQKRNKPLFESDIAKKLSSRIVGQQVAVQTLSKALLAPANGFSNKNAPTLGAFLLAGAPGIGKTEIAKSIADLMFDGRLCIVRGGDFSSDTSITTLTGAGAGLVGYGEPNPIEQKLREWHGSPGVVLIDEFDQAHPSIMRWLYSILDEGRFNAQAKTSSSYGHEYETIEVSLKNAFIILTSNLGMDKTRLGFKQVKSEKEENDTRISEIIESGSSSYIPKALFDRVKVIPMNELTNEEKTLAVKRICATTAKNLQIEIAEKLKKIKAMQNNAEIKVAILKNAQNLLLNLSNGRLRGVKHLLNDDIYNMVLSSALKAEGELKNEQEATVSNVTFNVKANSSEASVLTNPFAVSAQITKR